MLSSFTFRIAGHNNRAFLTPAIEGIVPRAHVIILSCRRFASYFQQAGVEI